MFTDTHAHLSLIGERNKQLQILLKQLKELKCPFLLDIGTEPGDLAEHKKNTMLENSPLDFIYYSCGLWPSTEVIKNRENNMKTLKKDLAENRVVALGECGIDRRETNKDNGGDILGERELFISQIQLAKKLSLPLIIHSRDGYEETLSCLEEENYHHGVIHCFSYGINEVKRFLELGWYISFAGTITFKKTEKLQEALAFVPEGRLLLETDAPYLAPVPFRGQINSPLLISETYKKAALIRNTTPEKLAAIVEKNSKKLFLSSF